jgi:hypothetical protein
MRASCPRGRLIAAIASSVVAAVRISLPGVKKASSPSHVSVRMGTPHAAASKSRPLGHHPISTIARRVTFTVSPDEQKNAGCSGGGRWRRKKTLSVHGKSCGYCAPAIRKRRSGILRAGSMNSVSSAACRSAA